MSALAPGILATRRQRRLLGVTRLYSVVLGVLSTWTWRYTPNPDGISYIDISSYYLDGHWPHSSSGYWSPLYPSLVAVARLLGGTGIANAWVLAHAVNLVLFLCNIAAAEFLIRSVRARAPRDEHGTQERVFTWTVLVYLLVAWTSVLGITLRLLTPDLAVSALAYLAAGLSVKILSDDTGFSRWTALGAVLGMAYLAKTVMLPIGVAVMGALAIATNRRRYNSRHLIAMATVFALVCLPQIIYVSVLKEAPTIGDVGRLTHGWYTQRLPAHLWDIGVGSLPASLPSPDEPKRELRLLDRIADAHPMVYAVDGPFPGTLPIWYDASYWYRRVKIPVALRETLTGAFSSTLGYGLYFSPFLIAMVVAQMTARQRGGHKRSRTRAVLIPPAAFALAIYALAHWEPRYIAPFVVLLLTGIVVPEISDQRLDYMRNGFTFAAILLFAYTTSSTLASFRDRSRNERAHKDRLAIVHSLRERGVNFGTRIGYVGDPYTAYWAQLAGLRFVSLIPSQEARAFWAADSLKKDDVLRQMRDHGASVILARSPDPPQHRPGWIPVSPDGSVILYALHSRFDSVTMTRRPPGAR
jgi:hypothetical protein